MNNRRHRVPMHYLCAYVLVVYHSPLLQNLHVIQILLSNSKLSRSWVQYWKLEALNDWLGREKVFFRRTAFRTDKCQRGSPKPIRDSRFHADSWKCPITHVCLNDLVDALEVMSECSLPKLLAKKEAYRWIHAVGAMLKWRGVSREKSNKLKKFHPIAVSYAQTCISFRKTFVKDLFAILYRRDRIVYVG